MGNMSPVVSKADLPKVHIKRQTALSGGHLKINGALPTSHCHVSGEDMEFAPLKKGEQWLDHAARGPVSRQRDLPRSKMVDAFISVAIAAVETPPREVVDEPAGALAPQPHDPMPDFTYGDDHSQPHGVGDSCEPPKKQTQRHDASIAET